MINKKNKPTIVKVLLVFSGLLSILIGVVGIFIPLLPTTPFLLLAAFLFYKSSNKMYYWLIKNRYLGSYIENYRKYKAITLRAKIFSMLFLWLALSYSFFYFREAIWVQIVLITVGLAVSFHILRFKTLEKKQQKLKS